MSSDLCVFDDFSFSPISFLQDPIFQDPEDKISNLEQFSQNKFENLTISSKPNTQNNLSFDTQFLNFSNFEPKTEDFVTNPEEIISNPDRNTPTKFEKISVSPKPNSQNDLSFDTHFSDFSNLDAQTQNSQICIHSGFKNQSFGPHSYGGADNVESFMQRSYSSSSFNGNPSFILRPKFDFVNHNFENQIMRSLENSLGSGQIRRVCSTGDLQVTKSQGTYRVESSFIEEANFKLVRYSAEERKERIHRYRAKRKQRNFNKTIKYACRKTLADNRPRVRGRFARNDDTLNTLKTANFNSFEDEDESWVDGYIGEERTVFNILGPTQFQYYGFS